MVAPKPKILIILPLIILTLSLTSCANLTKTLTRSDVTDAQLQSTLLTQPDFPSYEVTTASLDTNSPSKVIGDKLNGKICDANSTLYSPLFVNKESTVTLINAAEPVCIGAKEAKAATIKNFSELLYVREKMLTASIVQQGGNVQNIKTTLLQTSTFGENTLSYTTKADINLEDESIPYQSITVVLFSDQAAVSVILESYGSSLPEDILNKAVTLSKTRLSLLG